jgi:predicted GIY-YIG superfamily endonuclease
MMTEQTTKKWKKEIQSLWPAAKGSLAKIYKPCIRKNCPACARGDKHPAWILSMSLKGRRKVMYVPLALVAQMRQAIKNGRKIEQLLNRTAQDLIKEHRKNRKTASEAQSKS